MGAACTVAEKHGRRSWHLDVDNSTVTFLKSYSENEWELLPQALEKWSS